MAPISSCAAGGHRPAKAPNATVSTAPATYGRQWTARSRWRRMTRSRPSSPYQRATRACSSAHASNSAWPRSATTRATPTCQSSRTMKAVATGSRTRAIASDPACRRGSSTIWSTNPMPGRANHSCSHTIAVTPVAATAASHHGKRLRMTTFSAICSAHEPKIRALANATRVRRAGSRSIDASSAMTNTAAGQCRARPERPAGWGSSGSAKCGRPRRGMPVRRKPARGKPERDG